ncbi:methyl-accepting chemotaxis protein [Candidatus Contubernalis alkaliaceticus]|uniref:methyl-accepting chemotaxis protein n=1 Tax=Candidatus Contubernalis alkaliaceticus TaxID=338645 RepID=UPI001F4C2E37|nr:methyl-accepting chemotaxis protein [Candidatus Contubernalis alkalaceticus]UNC90659.1 cache domain-containing protein [Candidatus Contubernalis alkalaceticus]
MIFGKKKQKEKKEKDEKNKKVKIGLGTKLVAGFLVIALVPMIMAAYTAIIGINEGIETQAQSAINSDLNSANEILGQRVSELTLLTSLISLDESIAAYVQIENQENLGNRENRENLEVRENLESLERILSQHYELQNLSFLTVTDSEGSVIYRSSSDNIGDSLSDHPFFNSVLNGGILEGVVILEEDYLLLEGLADEASLIVAATEDTSESVERRGLALVSAAAIYNETGAFAGMIVIGDILNNNFDMVDRIGELLGVTSTFFLNELRVSTNVRDLSGNRAVGTRISSAVGHEVLTNGERYLGKAFVVTEDYITAYDPIIDPWGDIVGILYVGIPEAPFITMKSESLNRFIVIGVISLVMAVIIAYYLTRGVTIPVNDLAKWMKKAEDGDLSVKVISKSRDELGLLANSFDNMLEGQRDIIKKVSETTDRVSRFSQDLSSSIEESNAAMQEISSTVEGEVAKKAQDIALISQQATESGAETQRIATDGGQAVDDAMKAMLEIDQATSEVGHVIMELDEGSKQIEMIVNTITGIAEQTNLLALNAAIEAARAGEQGRGFAVVAEEVRKLAEGSSSAAGEIGGLISDIQGRTGNAVEKMKAASEIVKKGAGLGGKAREHLVEIQKAVEEMSDLIKNIASAVEEQSASTEEIAASTEEQTNVLDDISKTTSELAYMAEELNGLIRRFKL